MTQEQEINNMPSQINAKKSAVVFIAHCYPSGLVYHLAFLACALERASHNGDCDLFVCSHRSEQYSGSWALLRERVPHNRILTVDDYGESIRRCIEKLFDDHGQVLVHFGGGHHQLFPLLHLRRRFGERLRLVATTHSYQHDNWKRLPVSAVQHALYRRYVDHVIFQCPYAARRFVGGQRLLSAGRASIIPLGVEDFSGATAMPSMPEDPLGMPDIRPLLLETGVFNIVYLGAFRPGKGHLWLLEALADAIRKYPQVRIFFLGDGPVLPVVRQAVKQLDLGRQVIVPGRIERGAVPFVLSRCHCALVPSRAETFGHCFAEPMAAGLPVIGTRVGAAEYLIQDMMTGIGFSFGDSHRLRSAVEFLVSHPDAARNMGRSAQGVVAGFCSHDGIAMAHWRLYQSLLGDTAGDVACRT